MELAFEVENLNLDKGWEMMELHRTTLEYWEPSFGHGLGYDGLSLNFSLEGRDPLFEDGLQDDGLTLN